MALKTIKIGLSGIYVATLVSCGANFLPLSPPGEDRGAELGEDLVWMSSNTNGRVNLTKQVIDANSVISGVFSRETETRGKVLICRFHRIDKRNRGIERFYPDLESCPSSISFKSKKYRLAGKGKAFYVEKRATANAVTPLYRCEAKDRESQFIKVGQGKCKNKTLLGYSQKKVTHPVLMAKVGTLFLSNQLQRNNQATEELELSKKITKQAVLENSFGQVRTIKNKGDISILECIYEQAYKYVGVTSDHYLYNKVVKKEHRVIFKGAIQCKSNHVFKRDLTDKKLAKYGTSRLLREGVQFYVSPKESKGVDIPLYRCDNRAKPSHYFLLDPSNPCWNPTLMGYVSSLRQTL